MLVTPTNTLIIGASVSGLACAACLQKHNIDFIIIEKENRIADPWYRHYDRLHLHTSKNLSCLPYKKFAAAIPVYPSKEQVIEYLTEYRAAFNIQPIFNTEAIAIKRKDDYWLTETNNGIFKSKYLIMATGAFSQPNKFRLKGMETFPGKILHSAAYKSGKEFSGQKILVVGFGNSACEIAIDLVEQNAIVSMSVRSAVNVIPRSILGMSIVQLSLFLKQLPPRLVDTLSAPLINLFIGNISKFGLKKKQHGPLMQIQLEGKAPVLDIGTIKLIKKGLIEINDDIDFINGNTVHFKNGKQEYFDAVIACTGYYPNYTTIVDVNKSRFEDLKLSIDNQHYFGNDGLYFCGYWISPTGQIREIGLDAQKIVKDIAQKEKTRH